MGAVDTTKARARSARTVQAETERAAARRAADMRRLITEGLAAVRAQVTDAVVDDAYPDLASVVDAIDWTVLLPMTKAAESDFIDEVILDTMAAGADTARFAVGLDLTDPFVIAHARRLAGNLVSAVAATSRTAIRTAVTRSVSAELTRPQLRALVRDVVGLTPRQARAVTNYTLSLHRLAAGDTTRAAIESRFTLTPRLPAEPTRDQIRRLTDAYAQRQLRWRARNIERTELIRASNAGRVAGWEQAVRDGLIPATSKKVWVTVPDERRCDRCAPMDGQTISLIGGEFRSEVRALPGQDPTPIVPVLAAYPPIHPSCRCTVDVVPA
jgi:hypothetical protein